MPDFAALEDRLNDRTVARAVNAVASWVSGQFAPEEFGVVFDNDSLIGVEGVAIGRNPVATFLSSSAPTIRRGDQFAVTQRGVTANYWVLKALPDGTGMVSVQLTEAQP